MVNGYNAVHYPKDTILFSGNYDVAGDISVSANFEKLDKMFANSIYDFLGVTNVKVNHFDDIKYGKQFRNKIKENK